MAYGLINADVIGTSVAGSNLGAGNASAMKNRIINGAMVIDQRNAGASVTPTTKTYITDRFFANVSQASKFSIQQNAGSVTPPVGFTNYLGVTSLSAYSLVAGDYFFIQQSIEGYNWADLNWGSANAKTVSLSFWVRSSLTGTFGGCLTNGGFNRSYPFTYTISAANTWQQISVTIAGDTSGTWLTDNNIGIQVTFSLGTGSTFSGTAGSWSANGYTSATGATSVVGTNGATFYITGVQLEVGSSATGFEYVNYQTSLANCQRYYQQIGKSNNVGYQPYSIGVAVSTTQSEFIINLPVMMRTSPSFTFNGATNTYINYTGGSATLVASDVMSPSTIMYYATGSGLSTGGGVRHYQNASNASSMEISAEL